MLWRAMGIGTLPLFLAACDPFAAMTTEVDRELSADEVAELTLLSSPERLPNTASKVRLHFVQFQDPLLHVRFKAPLQEAEQFVVRYVGEPLTPGCGGIELSGDWIEWWLRDCPPGARYSKQTLNLEPARANRSYCC